MFLISTGHQSEGNEHFQYLSLISKGQVLFTSLEVESLLVHTSCEVNHVH